MKKKLNCMMLVDDNSDDNFFHEREIKKANVESRVIVNESGEKALEYLRQNTAPHSDLIFLDINMPGMNGWEFLREYDKLSAGLKGQAVVIMLTTSDNEDDRSKAKEFPAICAYITKPLTRDKIDKISREFFE